MVKTVAATSEFRAERLVKVPVLIVPKRGSPRAVRFPSGDNSSRRRWCVISKRGVQGSLWRTLRRHNDFWNLGGVPGRVAENELETLGGVQEQYRYPLAEKQAL